MWASFPTIRNFNFAAEYLICVKKQLRFVFHKLKLSDFVLCYQLIVLFNLEAFFDEEGKRYEDEECDNCAE